MELNDETHKVTQGVDNDGRESRECGEKVDRNGVHALVPVELEFVSDSFHDELDISDLGVHGIPKSEKRSPNMSEVLHDPMENVVVRSVCHAPSSDVGLGNPRESVSLPGQPVGRQGVVMGAPLQASPAGSHLKGAVVAARERGGPSTHERRSNLPATRRRPGEGEKAAGGPRGRKEARGRKG